MHKIGTHVTVQDILNVIGIVFRTYLHSFMVTGFMLPISKNAVIVLLSTKSSIHNSHRTPKNARSNPIYNLIQVSPAKSNSLLLILDNVSKAVLLYLNNNFSAFVKFHNTIKTTICLSRSHWEISRSVEGFSHSRRT